MKVLYFDCFSGISGDMTLGALIDLGIDKELFKSELDKLNLDGYRMAIGTGIKNGITGIDVNVVLSHGDEGEFRKKEAHHHGDEGHKHHHHHHSHGHHHEPGHSHKHVEEHQHGRNLVDIEELIDSSSLKDRVKDFSKKVFREIARAEAKVHNKEIHEVHFHEVGAVDSIVDIVGTAICLDLLGVDKVYSSPLHDGHGFIECRHGMIPVPVPAVMEMLAESGIPLISEDINTELVTPTGMGIIKCLSAGFGRMPAMKVDRVGYGMGKRDTGRFNALRVTMGTMMEEKSIPGEIAVLETNIDDMSAEQLGYAMERLLESGALDVFYTPVYMKKNRPAVMLTVLAREEDEESLADIILTETSTIGIRRSTMQRYCMDREIVKLETEYGDVRVKVASRDGIRKIAPEYEDCRKIAREKGIPIARVYEMVNEKARSLK